MKDQLTNQLANIFREYLQKELSIKVKFQNFEWNFESSGSITLIYDHDVCRWKRDCFPSEVEIRKEIVWENIPKKELFEKDVMIFNWDKSQD